MHQSLAPLQRLCIKSYLIVMHWGLIYKIYNSILTTDTGLWSPRDVSNRACAKNKHEAANGALSHPY